MADLLPVNRISTTETREPLTDSFDPLMNPEEEFVDDDGSDVLAGFASQFEQDDDDS